MNQASSPFPLKSLLTHLLAMVLGIVIAVYALSRTSHTSATDPDKSLTGHSTSHPRDGHSTSRGLHAARTDPAKPKTQNHSELLDQVKAELSQQDFNEWLTRRKDDPRAHAEALVIVGMITGDPTLIRQGLKEDPSNAHLLFIGSTIGSIPPEERAESSSRLAELNPDNALAAMLHARHLLRTGQSEAGIQAFMDAADRPEMSDFRSQTQALAEDAYIGAGLTPDAAKIKSAMGWKLDHLHDLKELTNSLDDFRDSMAPEEFAGLRAKSASLGMRLGQSTKTSAFVDRVVGISMELDSLNGLSDNEASPYEGMTVAEAKKSIQAERQELREVSKIAGDMWDTFTDRPELMVRYVDRMRMMGEIEALKWLESTIRRGE